MIKIIIGLQLVKVIEMNFCYLFSYKKKFGGKNFDMHGKKRYTEEGQPFVNFTPVSINVSQRRTISYF